MKRQKLKKVYLTAPRVRLEMREKIISLAEEMDVTQSEIIRRALRAYLLTANNNVESNEINSSELW